MKHLKSEIKVSTISFYHGSKLKHKKPNKHNSRMDDFPSILNYSAKNQGLNQTPPPHNSNLILTIPTFTMLLPTFLSFPLHVPAPLLPPHLAYMAVFLASTTIDLHALLTKREGGNQM
ncbi:MAG: hypothetical protein QXQ50_09925, partial [Candidatus Bathyarchaeia archaeon]